MIAAPWTLVADHRLTRMSGRASTLPSMYSPIPPLSLSATSVPIGNGVNSPVIDRRSADTVVVTPSDRTIVIGGLISTQTTDKDSKVPILGDIPILGFAFKRKQKVEVKTELLIFLTPHVVRNPEDLAGATTVERQKLELAPKAFPKGEMERMIDKP